jgi:quercetin dioxygenase-like cupin family protein
MYKKGNAFEEQDRNGWIYGSFMPKGLQKDNRVEIKITTFEKGYSNNYHYQKTATKIDIIWEGEAVWEIEGEEVSLKYGDYVIVSPGVKTRMKTVTSSKLIVQTIKTPSDPTDKVSL